MNNVRGIRNNNPANIERGSAWKGLVPFLTEPVTNQRYYDKRFAQFSEMVYGIRALLVVLRTYHYKYKLNTISKVLHRYAPLCENNTYAYISNVCKWMTEMYNQNGKIGMCYISDDNVLCWFSNPQTPTFACRCLAKSICRQETGYELQDYMLDDAIRLL